MRFQGMPRPARVASLGVVIEFPRNFAEPPERGQADAVYAPNLRRQQQVWI